MSDTIAAPDSVGFGELPPAINALLQDGVVAYRTDAGRAEALFRQAVAHAPDVLATYFCLYKIHTYQGNLSAARADAQAGLARATALAGWPTDWRAWRPGTCGGDSEPARFALYTLKALAFIHLKEGDSATAEEMLKRLRALDPQGTVGWPVIEALLAATRS